MWSYESNRTREALKISAEAAKRPVFTDDELFRIYESVRYDDLVDPNDCYILAKIADYMKATRGLVSWL